ncbi:hypothetical protein Daus18300_012634 [Diaporthe australafricana]|uniref:Uncharacterized protein n=1 Tax=Diaporthe australafricana TaxID=127596 RepID=A0ABR3W272_9PEZI
MCRMTPSVLYDKGRVAEIVKPLKPEKVEVKVEDKLAEDAEQEEGVAPAGESKGKRKRKREAED